MKTHTIEKPQNAKRTLITLHTIALLSMICFITSSCSPWESEIAGIYQSAQEGNRLSQFAIIEEYKSFKDIVPEDTLEVYIQRYVNEGNTYVLKYARRREWKKYCEKNPKITKLSYDEQERIKDAIYAKWYEIGIEKKDHRSCQYYSNYFKRKYKEEGHTKDSIKAAELYKKAIELGNEDLRIRRDREAGFKAMFAGGIEWGKFTYENSMKEMGMTGRFIISCSYVYNYIISGVINLTFTEAWWKVILTLIGMLLLLTIPIMSVSLPGIIISLTRCKSKKEKKEALEETKSKLADIAFGIFFGLWNYMCFAVAMSSENLVWLENVYCMFSPDSAYGIQQYFPIIMNWLALIYLCLSMKNTYIGAEERNCNTLTCILKVAESFTIFLVSYTMAQIGGVLIVILLLAVFVIATTICALPSMATTLVSGTISAVGETITDGVTASAKSSESKVHGCASCMHWNSSTHTCEWQLRNAKTTEMHLCNNYTSAR